MKPKPWYVDYWFEIVCYLALGIIVFLLMKNA